jgi:CPA2 family monovalent cation:H+ antiporter-2
VLAIVHGRDGVLIPTGHEQLQAGDLLAVAGTQEAVEAAERLLAGREPGRD